LEGEWCKIQSMEDGTPGFKNQGAKLPRLGHTGGQLLISIRSSSQILREHYGWNRECIHMCMQHLRLLPNSHPDAIRLSRPLFDEGLSNDSLALSFEVSIHADTRRLFHALTAPEYIETWLSLPVERTGCSMFAARNDQDYVVEHSCEGNASILISGRYLVCRRRNLIFYWRVDGELNVPETKVDIRLRGEFERTKLLLRHSGFGSWRDLLWHRTLWNVSLGKLAALFGSKDREDSAVTRGAETGRTFRRGSELAS
jgi:uncharacterized protein YndB with AHSA1/START domain